MKFGIIFLVMLLNLKVNYCQTIKVPIDFSNLPNAIQAAEDGDTILVFPFKYTYDSDTIIIEKSLTIIGMDSIKVPIVGEFTPLYLFIKNATNVKISNIVLGRSYYYSGRVYPLNIENSSNIEFDNVLVEGNYSTNPFSDWFPCGSSIKNSREIFFKNSKIVGGLGWGSNGYPGGFGIEISDNSLVILDNSKIFGGYTSNGKGGYSNKAIVLNKSSICYANNCEIYPDVLIDTTSAIYYGVYNHVLNESTINEKQLEVRSIYPNPFNPTTNIKYIIYKDSFVNIGVYDILGRKLISLVNKFQVKGNYLISWNGNSENGELNSSGTYLLIVHTNNNILVKKLLLLK